MRIFDVGNKARAGFWCAAPDEDTAKDIALAAKHAKNRQALRVTDVTESFLKQDPDHHDMDSIHALLDGTATGQVVGIIPTRTFADVVAAMSSGTPMKVEKTRWELAGRAHALGISPAPEDHGIEPVATVKAKWAK